MPEHLSHQAATTGRDVGLLALLSELIDAHADTVQLLGEDHGECERWAHCDYLRALQRLGHETLARHELRSAHPACRRYRRSDGRPQPAPGDGPQSLDEPS